MHRIRDRRRQRAQLIAVKRQHPHYKGEEAQTRTAKRQCADVREREAQAMAIKRQSADYRKKEAQAKAIKRQFADVRKREAQAMATKRQSADYRKRQAQAIATKRQSADYREREAQAKKQSRIRQTCIPNSVLQASQAFISATKEGPDYTCVCCNRLMYRKTVIKFKSNKYSRAPEEFTVTVAESEIKQWICKTCNHALTQGKLPAQAKANNLKLEDIPPELSDLNALEVQLISMRIPFMKMVALPCGKQRAIHGPAVNVPTDLTPVCTLLPRLPSQTQMVPMKLKRKLCYKGHYMYQYIRPAKVLTAVEIKQSTVQRY